MAHDRSYFFCCEMCNGSFNGNFFFLVNREFTKLFTNGPWDEILIMSVILFPFAYSVNVIETPPLPQSNSNAKCINHALFCPISHTPSRGVARFSTSCRPG